MTQSMPSYNPADTKSMSGAMRIFADYLLNLIECCQPCVVQSVDYTSNTVIVKPAINVPTATGEYIKRDVIKLTAWRFASGGFLIHYPIRQGDTGWMIAADKDTSLFKQENAIADPNTNIKHQCSQGFYIPDKISGFQVSNEDKNNLVFQDNDGSEKISIGSNEIEITTSCMTISGDTTTTSKITGELHSTHGATGTFTSADSKTVSVVNGIITSIHRI